MNNLKAIRLAKGMSQVDVANKLNISRQAYYNYETGKRQADYETLLKLGEILGVSVEDIIRVESESKDLYETYKKFMESMKKRNAPDDAIRSEIYSMVSDLSDDQALYFRDFLKTMLGK